METAATVIACLGLLALSAGAAAAPPPAPAPHARLQEVPFPAVRLADAFWAPRIDTVRRVTIPDLLDLAQEQGKIDNFAIVAGRKEGKLRLYNSPDSDVYKLLEAAAYALAWRPDQELARRVDEVISLIAAAQAEDGYLNTQYALGLGHAASPSADAARVKRYGYGPEQRWRGAIEEWPKGIGQLYCAGHLFEAAAAHHLATGKRNFLDVATRLADHIAARFPPDKPIEYADHPQAGIGLVKLYEATDESRYLGLANRIVHGGRHARPVDIGAGESHRPLVEQRKAYGHAVRTGYLYGAATDLCRHLNQPATREALDSLWRSLVDRRVFLIGGVGNGTPYEQHGEDYELPNERCYCECCANIALAQWAHRLNLLHGQACYADMVELVAYNGGLAGLSLDGTKCFYANLLAVAKGGPRNPHQGGRARYLFCCPSKLPGFVAGIGRWAYATDAGGIYVNLYAAGSASIRLGEATVSIRQETRYPWDGRVEIAVAPPDAREFDLCLRIPGWAANRPLPGELYRFGDGAALPASLTVNGRAIESPRCEGGYVRVRRLWRKGDSVVLDLPMPARRVYADGKVQADRGRVALMRGPVVYCLEGADHDFSVLSVVLPRDADIRAEHRRDLLGGVTVLLGRGLADGGKPVSFTAVPYYAWQNRGDDEMTVWLVETPLGDAAPGGAGKPGIEGPPNADG